MIVDCPLCESRLEVLDRDLDPAGQVQFCPLCGGRIVIWPDRPPQPADAVEAEPKESPCPHCGEAVPAGSVFCPYCGQKVESEPPGAESEPPPRPSAQPPDPASRRRRWPLVLLGLVLLVVAAGGASLLLPQTRLFLHYHLSPFYSGPSRVRAALRAEKQMELRQAVEECRWVKQLELDFLNMGLVMLTRHNAAQWHVAKAWYRLPRRTKEEFVFTASRARAMCYGQPNVTFYDALTGRPVARMGVYAPKILE